MMKRNRWLYKYWVSNLWMFGKCKNKTEETTKFFIQYKRPPTDPEALLKKFSKRVVILDITKGIENQLKSSNIKKKYRKEIMKFYKGL